MPKLYMLLIYLCKKEKNNIYMHTIIDYLCKDIHKHKELIKGVASEVGD